jgi:hypothetical protein
MEVFIRTKKGLEPILDDLLLRGKEVVVPSGDLRLIKKITLNLYPLRKNGNLIVGWDKRLLKTVLLVVGIKEVIKKRNKKVVKYLVRI